MHASIYVSVRLFKWAFTLGLIYFTYLHTQQRGAVTIGDTIDVLAATPTTTFLSLVILDLKLAGLISCIGLVATVAFLAAKPIADGLIKRLHNKLTVHKPDATPSPIER